MTVPPLLIVTPLRTEAIAARRGAPGADVLRTGMGRDRSVRASSLVREIPGTVVVLGLGGGLHDGQRAGDVVVADTLAPAPPAAGTPVALPAAAGVAAALSAAGLRVSTGTIVSSPALALGFAARAEGGAGGALAVDMESWWLAGAGGPAPHGFAVVRVLSDAPGQELVSVRTPAALARAFRTLVQVARVLDTRRTALLPPTPTEVPS